MADSIRPSTGSSGRTAWDDKVQVYDDAEGAVGKDAPLPWNEGGEQPTAMESEIFDEDGAVRVQQRQREREVPQGCWYRFTAGIRGIWATKHTEDTQYDRELFIRTTLRELLIYVAFLIVLCIVTFGMTSSTQYYYTKVMSELFLDGGAKPFREIQNMDDFWDFAEGSLLPGLHMETWYNGDIVTDDQRNFIFFENKILGLPRLRQLRVRNDSCTVPDSFKREIKECYSSFSGGNEDRRPFGPQNGTAWVFRDAADLGGGGSYWGLVGTYSGGGFVQDLGSSMAESSALISELKQHKWITRATRAVSVDFTVYNANINLFSVIRLFAEFPATGGVLPSFSFRTVKLIRYVTPFDIFILVCEGIFCAFILYYIVEEIIEICKHRCSYFKNFWNILDIIVIALALACIAFSAYRQIMVNDKLDDLLRNERQYANFEFLSFAQTRFNDCIAIMIFFAWVKIFKYISFNKTMNQLSSTLSRCAKDVGGFAIMFFIFFFAYAQLGYLIFGTQVKDFSTFYDAVFTLLRTILGDFDFHELEQANRILGPLFFITYVFFVFFVLLNMFLAIINDTYAEVKAELATQKNEFEIGDYFKRGYYNMLRRMNIRKDKLVDIQGALHGTDGNGDKQVDYDEWRSHLKQRGYSEAEIEGMFAKYDMDGDRVLSVEEQANMSADLAGQRQFLENEISDARSMGPPSARSGFADFEGGAVGGYGFGGRGGGGMSVDDYNVLNRRVDRMEQSIGTVVAKIDATLDKLEAMEKVKSRHREKVARMIADAKSSGAEASTALDNLTAGLNKEMDRFDNDATSK